MQQSVCNVQFPIIHALSFSCWRHTQFMNPVASLFFFLSAEFLHQLSFAHTITVAANVRSAKTKSARRVSKYDSRGPKKHAHVFTTKKCSPVVWFCCPPFLQQQKVVSYPAMPALWWEFHVIQCSSKKLLGERREHLGEQLPSPMKTPALCTTANILLLSWWKSVPDSIFKNGAPVSKTVCTQLVPRLLRAWQWCCCTEVNAVSNRTLKPDLGLPPSSRHFPPWGPFFCWWSEKLHCNGYLLQWANGPLQG